ncbi:MAG: hypothetical protein DRQ60_02070 [Gammaproteobacteria bacterium]|nr:MAG: hypothetical protein DRQ60_02070 [Gammaproteobacteria bacterium]
MLAGLLVVTGGGAGAWVGSGSPEVAGACVGLGQELIGGGGGGSTGGKAAGVPSSAGNLAGA